MKELPCSLFEPDIFWVPFMGCFFGFYIETLSIEVLLVSRLPSWALQPYTLPTNFLWRNGAVGVSNQSRSETSGAPLLFRWMVYSCYLLEQIDKHPSSRFHKHTSHVLSFIQARSAFITCFGSKKSRVGTSLNLCDPTTWPGTCSNQAILWHMMQ